MPPIVILAAILLASPAVAQQQPRPLPAPGAAPAPAVPPAAAPATGQPAAPARPASGVSEAAKELAGAFELADADGRRRCAIALEARPQGSGLAIGFDKAACAASFPFLAPVAGWSLSSAGVIRLLDAGGRTVAEFGETEVGLYETVRQGDGVYFLSNHEGQEAPAPAVGDIVGIWKFARTAGRTICRIEFSEEPATEDSYKLALAPGCDRAIVDFAPAMWRMQRSDVVLISARGERLRFERGEGNAWRKVPEAGRPLLMTR